MTYETFCTSVEAGHVPESLSGRLEALWYARAGDWERAHTCAQEIHGRDGAWVHAHLHREEGDLGNAGYWYRQAGREMPADALEDERERLIRHFLDG